MKKNRLYIFILSALFPLLWLACSKELPADAPIDVVQGKYPVTFSLEKGISANPKTYATVTASEGERKVSEMIALVFNTSDGKFIGAPLPVTVSGQVAENQTNTDSKLTGSFDLGAAYGQNGKQIKFVLVANVSVASMQSALTNLVTSVASANAVTDLTLNDIKTLKILNAPDVQQQFVMLSTQEPQVTLQQNVTQSVSSTITMKRLSARIDTNIGSGAANSGLTLQKVVVKKSQQESYLYEKGGSTAHLNSGETNKEYAGLSGNTHTAYTYENSVANDTHLEVTLALDGVPLAPITVPFTGVAIERNHIYKVTFNRDPNDVTNPSNPTQNPPKITFKIDVNDWNVETASYIDDYANKTAPTIFKVVAMQSNWTTPVNPTTITVNTDNTQVGVKRAAHYLAVDVHSKSTQSEAVITSGNSWVNVNDVTTYAAGMQQQFQVTVNENTTGTNRTATIEFRNKLDANQKITLTITQEGRPKLALEYVAEYNLAPNGTDFATTHEYNNNQQGFFTWDQAVAKAADKSDYFLPSLYHWAGIFGHGHYYDNGSSYLPFILDGTKNLYNQSETIAIGSRGYKTYTADYKSVGNGVAYAIKMKGHGDTDRTAYRYRALGGYGDGRIVVDCIYLGNDPSININTVAQESFWTSPEVTREFWFAGHGHNNDKRSVGQGFFYWTPLKRSDVHSYYYVGSKQSVYYVDNHKMFKLNVRLFKRD